MKTYHITLKPVIDLDYDIEANSEEEAVEKAEALGTEDLREGRYEFSDFDVEVEDDEEEDADFEDKDDEDEFAT